jgi:hypothetical protein
MDRFTDPNDPVDRRVETTHIESTSDSGVTWFIVGALVIAAGVLAYLYFGGDADTTADALPPAIEAPVDGRAATPMSPVEPVAPTAPAPATPPAPAP